MGNGQPILIYFPSDPLVYFELYGLRYDLKFTNIIMN